MCLLSSLKQGEGSVFNRRASCETHAIPIERARPESPSAAATRGARAGSAVRGSTSPRSASSNAANAAARTASAARPALHDSAGDSRSKSIKQDPLLLAISS